MFDDLSWLWVWAGSMLTGITLGTIFFGGLWWTVRHCIHSSTSALWYLVSMTLRTVATLIGFYAVGAGQPVRLGLCMLGFILARVIVLRVTSRGAPTVISPVLHPPGKPPCA